VGDACPLYPFGDLPAMAKAIDELVESPDLARKLGARGRARATAKFSADRVVPEYESLYRRVLARAARP